MAIPPIQMYPMPGLTDLPANKVTWKPEPGRSVLLIHDMQNYFVQAYPIGQSPINELIAHIQALKARCAELGIPVIYSAQPGGQTPEQRGLLQDFWGSGINGGPLEKQIVADLEPSDQDIVLTKWRYSAFHKTELQEVLGNLGRDQLIICGIYGHIGCLMTACDAFMKDIQPFFIADAVADFSLEYHRMALKYAAERCAVIMTTQQLLEALPPVQDQTATDGLAEQGTSLKRIREQVAELLRISPSELDEHENLLDYGLDSVRMMRLVETWRGTGLDVGFADLAANPTLVYWQEILSRPLVNVMPNADYL